VSQGLPVLTILGGRDRLDPSDATADRQRAAGARVAAIDEPGHSVNVQRPTEVADPTATSPDTPHPADQRQPRQPMVHARSFLAMPPPHVTC